MHRLLKVTKRLLLLLFVIFALLLTSCSSFTDFVVMNESDYPLEIRYKVDKSPAGPLATSGVPATIEASRLSTYGGLPWTQLSLSQYQLVQEPDADIVIVRLRSKEALRLTSMRTYSENTPCDRGQSFPVTAILILSPTSKIELVGDRVRTSFFKSSRALCLMTYK